MKYPINTKHVREIQGSIWEKIKKTFSYRRGVGEPLPIYGHYGGVFQVNDERLVIHCDNIGTKILVAQMLNKFDTVGIDAVAMSVNDILCLGAEPLVGVDYIGLAKEDHDLVDQLITGLVNGCEQSNCALIGGETAITPELINENNKMFDIVFNVVGRIIDGIDIVTGDKIENGDVIIGLESSGLHSNGYTLARKVLGIKKWGNEMLTPTRIYVKPILDVLKQEKNNVHGIAHITGGAFSKLTRINKNVGFLLNNMPKMPAIFEELHRNVDDVREMYQTFNCGIGMTLVVKKQGESNIHNILKKHNLKSYTIGEITNDPKMRGVWLDYENKRIDLTLH